MESCRSWLYLPAIVPHLTARSGPAPEVARRGVAPGAKQFSSHAGDSINQNWLVVDNNTPPQNIWIIYGNMGYKVYLVGGKPTPPNNMKFNWDHSCSKPPTRKLRKPSNSGDMGGFHKWGTPIAGWSWMVDFI